MVTYPGTYVDLSAMPLSSLVDLEGVVVRGPDPVRAARHRAVDTGMLEARAGWPAKPC
jgi:hypothetical protein